MEVVYLLLAGMQVSAVHCYLVWRHSDNRRYSISEHAVLAKSSYALYVASHIICGILYFAYSYQFLWAEHRLPIPFVLNIVFIFLDFVQALLPSKGRTEKLHFAAAYISWVSYIVSGILTYASLTIVYPYNIAAACILVPIVGMFVYMHINRSKLYPYQLCIVPLFVLFMLLITIGAQ